MSTEMDKSTPSFDDEWPTIRRYCQNDPTKKYPTVSKKVRLGEIPLHTFPGVRFPRLNAAQANDVMDAIKRPYSGPDVRIIHHEAPPVDLFKQKVA